MSVSARLGKTQVVGEIKIALKKEMKTEGDNLVLEILQCRNITYKFKSPDHLPGNKTRLQTCSLMLITICVYLICDPGLHNQS